MKTLSLDLKTAAELLPKREQESNKGTFGKVLLIGGSYSMVGCCALLCEGALRSGAGLVTLAFPDCLYKVLASRLTENLFLPLETNDDGVISSNSINTILNGAENADVVAFGPGVGTSFSVLQIISALITESKTPLIIDADGLNVLSNNTAIFNKKSCEILITPHPGEMARLMHTDISFVQNARTETASHFASDYGVSVVLKGHNTVIASPDGEIYINNTGNSALAKGGSGDLLTGIIAGLAPGMKCNLFKAGVLGAFVHGLAGDITGGDLTEYSALPTDVAIRLPEAFKRIVDSK